MLGALFGLRFRVFLSAITLNSGSAVRIYAASQSISGVMPCATSGTLNAGQPSMLELCEPAKFRACYLINLLRLNSIRIRQHDIAHQRI